MITNDDLEAIGGLVGGVLKRLAERGCDVTEPYEAIGITRAAHLRGVIAYAKAVEAPSEAHAMAFSVPHAWGEMSALRRVKLALSDPRARGRALEVVAALEAGASVEAALTAPQRPESDCGAVVIPLRPKE